MSVYGWGTDHPVDEWLFAEGYRFDFYQAVKLLEMLSPDSVPVGEGVEPNKEAVRFKSTVGLTFPASDVAELIRPTDASTPSTMAVQFLGLAGSLGPLPTPYTELLLERIWQKDTALRDFLDVFNHRLVSLLYRVQKQHRIGLDTSPPHQNHVAPYLYAFMGLGTPGLRGRLPDMDRALLSYAGLVAQQPRSMVGLEALLADYFHVPVTGHQFVGQWYDLEADQLTTIGVSGQNQYLGHGVALGTRVWDQSGKLELHLGPLTLKAFLDLLPNGMGFRALCALTQFYVGYACDVSFRLTLKPSEIPTTRLSSVSGSRLGWTSYLITSEGSENTAQVHLKPSSPPPDLQKVYKHLFHELPTGLFAEVVCAMTVHHMPAHVVVMSKGEPGDSLFVIRHGKAYMHHTGAEELQDALNEGDFFGEMSFLTGQPRTATIVTAEASEILELPRPIFEAIMTRYPGLERVSQAFYDRLADAGSRRAKR